MTGVLMQWENSDAEKHTYKGGHHVKIKVEIRAVFQPVKEREDGQQTTRSWERGLEQTLTVLRSHQPADTLISQPPGWERMGMWC